MEWGWRCPNPAGCFPRNSIILGCEMRPQTSGGKRGGNCKCPPVTLRSTSSTVRHIPNEDPNEDMSEDFWRYARGYVQRLSGAFEFDYVSLALFNLLLQGLYRVDVGLITNTGIHFGSTLRNASEWVDVHRYPLIFRS